MDTIKIETSTFTKWVTDWPNMAGVVGGSVGDGAFSGKVLDYNPGPTTIIAAIYHFSGPRHDFTALVHVEQTGLSAVRRSDRRVAEGQARHRPIQADHLRSRRHHHRLLHGQRSPGQRRRLRVSRLESLTTSACSGHDRHRPPADRGPGTGLVGRESERAFLHLLLGDGGPAGRVHPRHRRGRQVQPSRGVHAPRRGAGGAIMLRLDCGAIEPTARGFLDALSAATGSDLKTADDAAARLASLGPRVILALDRYEVLRPARPVAPAGVRPGPERQRPHRPRRSRAAAWRAGRRRWVSSSAACRWATCRATMPRRCCARTASPATTSSASTGWRAATRCRCAWPHPRSWPGPSWTTKRPRSPPSSRS